MITGSGTGIGRAIAKKFVENGASVIILGRRREPLEDTAAMLQGIIKDNGSGAQVKIFSDVDVGDQSTMDGMFDSLKRDGTTIDYMVNNAGVSGPVRCFASAPLDEFRSTVQIHLTGTFWGSVQALGVMKEGAKIITISTFFTEERPLEQRPYRFRSPYTAAQGAKNRLAEAMSWELAEKGIISIATNPGPVHSDRIYKTVYPKAAAEFMRVSGFEEMVPSDVDAANAEILPLLGEDQQTIKDGITEAAKKHVAGNDDDDNSSGNTDKVAGTLTALLDKIQIIAEKVQNNTSHMIANREFLSQEQVATSVLNLCDDDIAAILNGKVVPGDRVFYPVKPHVGASTPMVHKQDFGQGVVVITLDATSMEDVARVESLADHITKCNGKVACFISKSTPEEMGKHISDKFHSHVIDVGDPAEIDRWLNTASTNMGKIIGVVHMTGGLPEIPKITELSRQQWDSLVERFIMTPAIVTQRALERFVPGGGSDPRLYKSTEGTVMIVGPNLPTGRKTTGVQRAQIEVFRGALRPFTTTVNQELSDVLKSRIRVFTVLPGTVTGAEPDNEKIAKAFDFFATSEAASTSAEVNFCIDESR